jgi:hypothetical protein
MGACAWFEFLLFLISQLPDNKKNKKIGVVRKKLSKKKITFLQL